MGAFINTAILGVFIYVCAGNYEPMKTVGFILVLVGMIGTTILYQNLIERIEKLERQTNKQNDIIRRKTVDGKLVEESSAARTRK